jgi:hypothetical protein
MVLEKVVMPLQEAEIILLVAVVVGLMLHLLQRPVELVERVVAVLVVVERHHL